MVGLRRVRWWGRHNDEGVESQQDGFATGMT